jgi:pyruvate kinase
MSSSSPTDLLPPAALLDRLLQLRADVLREGRQRYERWSSIIHRRSFCLGALNLAYYLALRKVDLRQLQASLQPLGMSSLGRSESRVIENLDAVIATLGAILNRPADQLPARPTPPRFFRGQRMLDHHARHVLGEASPTRHVRIMVTLPTEAADNPDMLTDLLQRGMSWARINCAHDDETVWADMIDNVRAAEAATGKRCHILMDLGGPKVRTGEVRAPSSRKRLMLDDMLVITRHPPKKNKRYPFQAQCQMPEVLAHVKVGDSVWIDDGKIGAVVEEIVRKGLLLRVTRIAPDGEKLKPEKGIDFPDTMLPIPALTEKDITDLAFVATHADAVGYSFVQTAGDVQRLQEEMEKHGNPKLAIVAKIETELAIRNLPEIIVQAGGKSPFAVMIARGDMAVEIGFQRTAEMQEEILWLCEAAHIPVIWATQVLENMVKKGIPTRAEMTDAAMAQRAECVMLNKGEYIADAVSLLNDVLTRMHEHQQKKTPQLRALRSWNDEET